MKLKLLDDTMLIQHSEKNVFEEIKILLESECINVLNDIISGIQEKKDNSFYLSMLLVDKVLTLLTFY